MSARAHLRELARRCRDGIGGGGGGGDGNSVPKYSSYVDIYVDILYVFDLLYRNNHEYDLVYLLLLAIAC